VDAESAAQENEVALGVKQSLDHDDKFIYLPRVINNTEWDAVFLDTKENRLLFVETKHKVTYKLVSQLIAKAKRLPEVLKGSTDEAIKPHIHKPFKIIMAGLVFDKKAARKALKNGIGLCYVTRSRYSVRQAALVKEDLNNETFTSRKKE
jgi:hypothetical protein